MTKNKKKLGAAAIMFSLLLMPITAYAAEEVAEYTSGMYGKCHVERSYI